MVEAEAVGVWPYRNFVLEACKLRWRMGDPKGAALAACPLLRTCRGRQIFDSQSCLLIFFRLFQGEEAKAYHGMKAQAASHLQSLQSPRTFHLQAAARKAALNAVALAKEACDSKTEAGCFSKRFVEVSPLLAPDPASKAAPWKSSPPSLMAAAVLHVPKPLNSH